VDWLLQIGGITVEYGKLLGTDLTLAALKGEFDAVFLSIGLAGVNSLRAEGEDLDGVRDAVEFIEELRQAEDLSALPVGRNVVVIGGGMTAVDAAVQSKLLGAENVTIAYRRDREAMGASRFEQDLAASKGVTLLFNVMPKAIHGNGAAAEIELEYTSVEDGRVRGTGETMRLAAEQVYKAIGQSLVGQPEEVELDGGKIMVDATGRTSVAMVWAGGDCASGGEDLTVTAVAEGRDAAMDIHTSLMG
jgi:glutamate synthase (NADPH/NADH) small chain